MEIIEGADGIDEEIALQQFKEKTEKQRSAFNDALASLVRRGLITKEDGRLCEA